MNKEEIYRDIAVYGSARFNIEWDENQGCLKTTRIDPRFIYIPESEWNAIVEEFWYRRLKANNKRNKRMRRHMR